jgi:hypothetical protein
MHGESNCHEFARLSNLEKRRQEEARAHTGLLSHGYYYYYYSDWHFFLIYDEKIILLYLVEELAL